MTGPFSTLREVLSGQDRGNIRLVPLLNLIIVSCLLFGTLSDIAFRISAERNGSVSRYDTKKQDNDRKGILGSAMISTITGALSPILPFAGGVDLRRDDAWKSWRSYLRIFGDVDVNVKTLNGTNAGEKVSLIPRGGAVNDRKKKSGASSPMVLSASSPFLPMDDIAGMTLREISFSFRYVIESGRQDFDLNSFLARDFEGEPVNGRMVKAVHAMEDAVGESRGEGILPAVTSLEHDLDNMVGLEGPMSQVGYGDIDALRFCAAMRILAEWRVLRQVPPGYKGYAVGMSLGHKDVVQNVAKIENAAHEWIDTRSAEEAEKIERERLGEDSAYQRRSPTLRQLLAHEIDGDIHPNNKLPRLKEKSAAMGLLWVRRQLHYQTSTFDNVISVPTAYPTVIEAVGAAYTEVYGNLHGWAVQKIFNYSFQSAPGPEEIFRHMNPHRLREVTQAALNGAFDSDVPAPSAVPVPTLDLNGVKGGNPFLDFFSNIGSEFDKVGRHIGSEFDKVGNHIGGEWDKTVCNVSNVFKNGKGDDCDGNHSLNTRGGATESLSDGELDQYISKKMHQDAKAHILVYLNIARPMLTDLAGLFDEMNMDDPTKV